MRSKLWNSYILCISCNSDLLRQNGEGVVLEDDEEDSLEHPRWLTGPPLAAASHLRPGSGERGWGPGARNAGDLHPYRLNENLSESDWYYENLLFSAWRAAEYGLVVEHTKLPPEKVSWHVAS